MAANRRTTGGRFIRGRSTPELQNICLRWSLSNAADCLPQTICPDGNAEDWPALLVTRLSELAEITHGELDTIKHELQQVHDLRLKASPDSDPDLLVQDIDKVYKRWDFRRRVELGDASESEMNRGTPSLDGISTPPSSGKKRKRVMRENDGSGRRSEPRSRYQESSSRDSEESPSVRRRRKGKMPVLDNDDSAHEEEEETDIATEGEEAALVAAFPPMPNELTVDQRLAALRQKKVAQEADASYYRALRLERKAKSDLEHTKYEMLLLEYEGEE